MTQPAPSRNLFARNPVRGRFVRDGDPVAEPASILALPNVISIIRILFIPAMVWLILADAAVQVCTASLPGICTWFPFAWDPQYGVLRWIAAGLFIVAIATDWIDGRIARSRHLITDLGIFLDPVADKGLTGAALVSLAIVEPEAWFWWPVVILILVREWGITWWRAVALKDRVIPAASLGKLKTAAQGVVISLALLPFQGIFGPWFFWVDAVLMLVVLVLTLWSGIDYLVKAYRRPPDA